MTTHQPSVVDLVDNPALHSRVAMRARAGDREAQVLLDRLTAAWADAVRDADTDQTGGTAA